MKSKIEDIEEFTQLKDYLKFPVRTYSNGMRLRLAFAISTCIESDIIILDEVIGVGDAAFMARAQARLKDVIHRSSILILTSHSENILRKLCNKALVLEQGKCLFFGDLEGGLELYQSLNASRI